MKQLGIFILRRSNWILVAAAVVMIVAGVYGTSVFSKLESGGFEAEGSQSYKTSTDLREQFKNSGGDVVILYSSKNGLKATDADFATAVKDSLAPLKDNPEIEAITSYYSTGAPALVSHDTTQTFATLRLHGDLEHQLSVFPEIKDDIKSDSLDIKLGGLVPTNDAFGEIIESDLKNAEIISFSLLTVLLLIVFRSVVAALLPVLLGGFAILGAFLLTRILTNFMDISQYAINVIIFLGLGLAIDYSLFIVSRFREELRATGNVATSLETTMATAGRAVLFSGITVMISLLGLLIFPLSFEQSMGIGGAAAVLVAMIGALLVLPAILARIGGGVNALSFGSARRDRELLKSGSVSTDSAPTMWYKMSRFVMAHPVTVIILTIIPLIIAGLPFLRVNLESPDYRSLPQTNQAYEVSDSLKKDFPKPGEPIVIIVKTEGSPTSASNIAALYTYNQQIASIEGVSNIDSLVSTGKDLSLKETQNLFVSGSPYAAPLSKQFVGSNKTSSIMQVYFSGDTLGKEAQRIVKDIRAVEAPARLNTEVGGETAKLVDLLAVLERYVPYALALIITALLVLLFFMIGSIVIPIKAVVLNLLSLSASFGALVWIFQDGHLENIFGFESVGAIDSSQPILIFAIAFGLSMDYAVFLLSRIKEQYDKTGDTEDSIAEGVKRTGNIITSAALMLIVVVGAFGTSQIPLMKQLAVGLVLAIAIDAVIVRMLLIPATMKLLGKYNWWAPVWLKKAYSKLGLEG